MEDIQFINSLALEITKIIRQQADILEKESKIKELLKDIEGEITIKKRVVDGVERISRVDVEPKTVRLFEEFNFAELSQKSQLFSKLYTAYLLCNQTGNPKELHKTLLEYERVTHYPITKCSPSDKEWLMTEASLIIDSTLVQPKTISETEPDNELVKVIKKVFPEGQVKQWF